MKITKLGHCCLVIDISTSLDTGEQGLRILTDPGNYSTAQNEVKGIDAVLITHEHPDHLHVESLKQVLANNPEAKVFTNTAVGKILEQERIGFDLLENGQQTKLDEVTIESFDQIHAEIYPGWPRVQNTGYFVGGKMFYPGDAFIEPGREIEILGLPVAGPWMKISEAIDYALKLKPKRCFPVHDGILKRANMVYRVPTEFLGQAGIEFVPLEEGQTHDF